MAASCINGTLFDGERDQVGVLHLERTQHLPTQGVIGVIDGQEQLADLEHGALLLMLEAQNINRPNTTAATMPTKSAVSPVSTACRMLRMPTEPKYTANT